MLESEYGTVEDFLQTLNRLPTPSNESIEKGFMFEKWCEENCLEVQGRVFQYAEKKQININGMKFLLYGRMDCIKAGVIYDFKYTGNYECGKYYGNVQTPAYFELLPEALEMKYIITNKCETLFRMESEDNNELTIGTIFTERYTREEITHISSYILEFMNWLEFHGYMELYKRNFVSMRNEVSYGKVGGE